MALSSQRLVCQGGTCYGVQVCSTKDVYREKWGSMIPKWFPLSGRGLGTQWTHFPSLIPQLPTHLHFHTGLCCTCTSKRILGFSLSKQILLKQRNHFRIWHIPPCKTKCCFHRQVDLLAPMIIHSILTQGARQKFSSLYISQFIIMYSLDGQRWQGYRGNSTGTLMVCN